MGLWVGSMDCIVLDARYPVGRAPDFSPRPFWCFGIRWNRASVMAVMERCVDLWDYSCKPWQAKSFNLLNPTPRCDMMLHVHIRLITFSWFCFGRSLWREICVRLIGWSIFSWHLYLGCSGCRIPSRAESTDDFDWLEFARCAADFGPTTATADTADTADMADDRLRLALKHYVLQNLGAAKHGAVKKRRRKLKEVEGSWRKLKLRSFHVMFIDIRANRFYSSSLGCKGVQVTKAGGNPWYLRHTLEAPAAVPYWFGKLPFMSWWQLMLSFGLCSLALNKHV